MPPGMGRSDARPRRSGRAVMARRGRGRSVAPGAVPRDPDRPRAADPPGGHALPGLGQPLDRGVLVDLRAQATPGPLAVQVVRRPGPAPQPFPRTLLVARAPSPRPPTG